MASGHFVAEGRAYYEQGNHKRAIDSFSKALLSDPDNEEAKEYLNKLGVSGSIYLGKGTQLDEITRLSRTVSELQAQNQVATQEAASLQQTVVGLQIEKSGLENDLDQKREEIVNLNADLFQMKHALNTHLSDIQAKTRELTQIETELALATEDAPGEDIASLEESKGKYEGDVAGLQEKLKKAQARTADKRQAQNTRIKELEKELAVKQTQLMMVNDKLVLAKRKIKERYAQLSKKDKTIGDLKRSLNALKDDLRQTRLKLRTVGRNKTVREDLTVENEEQVAVIKKQDAFILELKDKLVEARRELSDLKKKLGEQPSGSDKDLQAQLEETMQQLDETQMVLKEKNEEYEILQQRFDDTRERLELVEGMMKDKDTQIEDLEKDLDVILEDTGESR